MSGQPAGPDVVELYVEALAAFGNAVRDVADHEWDLPTPCHEWNVKEVVAHVVLGEAQLPEVLAGETTDTQAAFGAELLGLNPLSTWRGTALRAIDAARRAGVVDEVFVLDTGQVTGRELLGYRITDNVIHAWDVAVGVGRGAPIDGGFADWLLDFWQPKAAQLSGSESFADPFEPPTGASPGDRLLALLGRSAPNA